MYINQNLKSIKVTFSNPIEITTDDAEYGKVAWIKRVDGYFTNAGGGWYRWEDQPIPNGGDAAMELEADIASVVKALFDLFVPVVR